MDKCTVLHVIGGGEIGGAEKHILDLLQGMDRNQFNPRLCCLFPAPFAQVAQAAGIPVDVIDMRSKFNLQAFRVMEELLVKRQVDIVHTHGVRANLVGRIAARRAGIQPIITTVHSILEQDYPSFLARFSNGWIEKLTAKYVTHFVTVSDLLKKDLMIKGIPADKITTIYNGIDFHKFSPKANANNIDWRQKLGIAPEVPVVGILARLHPVKGHRYFLEAAALIKQKVPQVHFLIVGSGLGKTEITSQIDELNLTSNVTLTGFVEDIQGIYRSLDVLVISSLSEGFGLTAVEAMAMGVPVVATDVGGLPEIIDDGVTGFLVPPANAEALAQRINYVLQHPTDVQGLTQAAYTSVEQKFSRNTMAKATEALYLDVIAELGGK